MYKTCKVKIQLSFSAGLIGNSPLQPSFRQGDWLELMLLHTLARVGPVQVRQGWWRALTISVWDCGSEHGEAADNVESKVQESP